MRNYKRAISLLIAVVILVSLAAPAFADTGKTFRKYKNYVCIGDSIAAGCGLALDGTEPVFDQSVVSSEDAYAVMDTVYIGDDWSEVPDAYHSIVREALGCELLQCARSGMRTVEYNYLLGCGYNDSDASRTWGNTYFDIDGNGSFSLSDLDALGETIDMEEAIKSADVLSINLGSNDVFSAALGPIAEALLGEDSATLLGKASDFIGKTGAIGQALGMVIDAADMPFATARIIATMTSVFNDLLAQFKANYTTLMDKIYKLNPDINIVAVGAYNPLANFSLKDGSRIDLRILVSPVLLSLNSFIEGFESKYKNYYYADVLGTETYKMNLDDPYFWEYALLKVHPTKAGHAFMAEQILDALPAGPSEAPSVTAGNDAATGMVKLTWDKVANADSYKIYRATSKSGTYKLIGETTIGSFIDTGTKAGVKRYYKVAAISGNVKCTVSSVVYRTADCGAPVVKATNIASTGKIKLTWNKVIGAEKYVIYRATSKSGTYKKMFTTTGTSYTNTSAKAGTTYYYKVKAICDGNTDGNSAYSNIVSRCCDFARPTVKITTSSGHPKLSWAKIDGATKYIVYRATSKTGTYSELTTTTKVSYTDKKAKAGKTYYYKIKAINGKTAANSAYSSVVSIKAK